MGQRCRELLRVRREQCSIGARTWCCSRCNQSEIPWKALQVSWATINEGQERGNSPMTKIRACDEERRWVSEVGCEQFAKDALLLRRDGTDKYWYNPDLVAAVVQLGSAATRFVVLTTMLTLERPCEYRAGAFRYCARLRQHRASCPFRTGQSFEARRRSLYQWASLPMA